MIVPPQGATNWQGLPVAWSQRDAWVHPRRCWGPAQEELRTGLFIMLILLMMAPPFCIIAWKFSNKCNFAGWTKPCSNCLGSRLPERSDDHHWGKTFPTKNLGLDTTFFMDLDARFFLDLDIIFFRWLWLVFTTGMWSAGRTRKSWLRTENIQWNRIWNDFCRSTTQ